MNPEAAERLRNEYEATGITTADLVDDPFDQFEIWFSGVLAAGISEPNAFVLATADGEGHPSARALLMKDISQEGLVFYTNLESPKSADLKVNPRAAATFVWTPLHRQVRFEGRAEELEAYKSDEYWATRSRGAQIAAHASKQSQVVGSREELEAAFSQLDSEYGDDEIPRPDNWGGWRVVPDSIEFWQGRPNRFHDRIRYRLEGEEWVKERLAP